MTLTDTVRRYRWPRGTISDTPTSCASRSRAGATCETSVDYRAYSKHAVGHLSEGRLRTEPNQQINIAEGVFCSRVEPGAPERDRLARTSALAWATSTERGSARQP